MVRLPRPRLVVGHRTERPMTGMTHKLIRQGKGEHSWGECSCGQWAWLGTYEMPRGRLPKLRVAHAEHVSWAQTERQDERDDR